MQSTVRKALDWPDEENGEVGVFLSFMNLQIDAHPEWIAPSAKPNSAALPDC